MIKKLDEFIIEQVGNLVQLMQDWLFLSQKWIERGVLALFVLICLASVVMLVMAGHPIGLEIGIDIFIFIGMLLEYHQPKTERALRRVGYPLLRIIWIASGLLIFGTNLYPTQATNYMHIYYCLGTLWALTRILMAYITILDIDGERGKAAKLSWEKLKELFGTSWVPQPQRG